MTSQPHAWNSRLRVSAVIGLQISDAACRERSKQLKTRTGPARSARCEVIQVNDAFWGMDGSCSRHQGVLLQVQWHFHWSRHTGLSHLPKLSVVFRGQIVIEDVLGYGDETATSVDASDSQTWTSTAQELTARDPEEWSLLYASSSI